MTANDLPAEPFSVRVTAPKSISALLASSDPTVRALVQSIRDEAQAHFAIYLEAKGKEKLVVAHRSPFFDPYTHEHVLIADPKVGGN